MTQHSIPEIPPVSKMSALIRAKDWSKTILGPADNWPPSLTLLVNIMLASGFPMAVRWGPDFVMIYNDGYQPILGEKHPWALGLPFHEVWPEVQPQLRPLHEAILAGKRGAFFAEDLLLRIQRHGAQWEDARFTISYSPIPDPSSPTGVGGVLITAVETTNRVQTEEALRASENALREREAELRLVLDSATDAFYCVDTEGTTTKCNVAFLRMLGIEREEDAIGKKLHDVIHHTHPDGSPYPKEECPIYRVAQGGGSAHVDTDLFFRFDGTSFPVEYWVSAIKRGGELQGAVCTFVDITERQRSQEQQKLLLGELNHRVKNLFAIMDGVISSSARSAKTPQELTKKIKGRLNALALAHQLVLPDLSRPADAKPRPINLDDLLWKILSPYNDANESGEHRRLLLSGSAVAVGARAVTNIALVLHEFATNSAKYGALSAPQGCVEITWVERDDILALKWEERGGPPLTAAPMAEGFGTLLSGHIVRGQFGGTLSYDWKHNGLVVDLSFPVERLRN
jgi:PAS domain S-box-containing protein